MGTPPSPVVASGAIRCFRLFDLGDEIVLEEAKALLEKASVGKAHLDRSGLGAMDFVAVPLRVDLGERELLLPEAEQTFRASLEMHLFPHGTASLAVELPIAPGTALADLTPLCRALYEAPSLTALGRSELKELLPGVAGAILDPHEWDGFETYTLLHLYRLEGDPLAAEVLAWPGLAKLLVGETSPLPLGDRYQQEVLEHASSYQVDDLVVIDWNSALLLDSSGKSSVVGMLEFANSQLVGLRYYDAVLDGELRLIYAEFDQVSKKKRWRWNPYTKLAHRVFRRLIEISELSERIDNAIKVTGNFYLARLYRMATARLRIAAWHQSITRKQEMISQAYTMFKDEAELKLSTALEVTVVILIVIEVVMAFVGH